MCNSLLLRPSDNPINIDANIDTLTPTAEFALRLSEVIETLVRKLGAPRLKTIAQRKLEGYSNEDIARGLNVSPRTIVRKLARIQQEWDESR